MSLTKQLKDLLSRLKHRLHLFNKRSELVDKYLLNLRGIEIGAASYREFGLNTLNVDINDNQNADTVYCKRQLELAGRVAKVDVVAPGDNLPFEDNSWDFVLTSHVLEHFFDPIKALKEWNRVVKDGGYICLILPDKTKTVDKVRERTTLSELIDRHANGASSSEIAAHHNVWVLEDILELCKYLNLNVIEYREKDKKVKDSFIVMVKVSK